MPFSITIHPDRRVGRVELSGHTTGGEMLEACRTLVMDPAWEPGFDELWDFLEAPEVDVVPDEIDALVASAHQLRERFGGNRVAFVTRHEPVALLLRLFELFTSDLGRTYRTFLTVGAAADWLGVPVDADA